MDIVSPSEKMQKVLGGYFFDSHCRLGWQWLALDHKLLPGYTCQNLTQSNQKIN